MRYRNLGKTDAKVSAVGLGCMSMTPVYDPPDDVESLATLNEALDRGVNFVDSSDAYGKGKNEELLANILKTRRDDMFLCTKFGNVANPDGSPGADGRPGYVIEACDNSLKRLGVDVIDLYYQHRVDPRVPIEETVGAMAALVDQGKVRYLGLSEASAATLRRAYKVHPIAALQTEYSIWCREPAESELLPACRELGVTYVAYAPLGRGFLTAQFLKLSDLPESDRRRQHPRFFEENFNENLAILTPIREIAAAKGCTPAQLCIAWLLAKDDAVLPLPGSKRRVHLADNIGAIDVELTAEEVAKLDAAAPGGLAKGDRYPTKQMATVNV